MTEFDLHLSVRTGSDRTDLVLELPAPLPWSAVSGAVCRAVGIAEDSRLFRNGVAVGGGLIVGRPPLLTGTELTTEPELSDADLGPPAGALQVCCVAGPDAGRAVAVLHEPVVVGRDADCDLAIADDQMSARHARVDMTSDGPRATDLGSVNGLSVGGGPTGFGPVAVPEGAMLRLGSSRFVVRLAAEPPLSTAPDGRGGLLVSRPPRLLATAPTILAPDPGPPPVRPRRAVPVLAAVIGAAVGGVLVLVTGQLLFLLMAAVGPITMIGSALADRWSGRRSYRRELAAHRAAARTYDASVAAALDRHRREAWDRLPDPCRCLARATRPGSRLWERRPADPDFGVVSLGVGTGRAAVAGAHQLADLPVPFALRPDTVLGLAGPAARGLARWLVLQAATLHAPGDLRLVGPDDLVPADLPHTRPGPGSAGFRLAVVPCGPGSAKESLAGCAVVHVAPTVDDLPHTCTAVIATDGGRATLTAGAASVVFEPTLLARDLLDRAAAALAPLIDRPAADDGGSVVRAASLAEAWQQPTARTRIGTTDAGPMHVDLDRDGPHLLVAGTTGSGKSELLITLIADLARAAPPTETSFLLVDYKGGAAFAAVARLPHVTALVTDLDPDLATRGLTSLRAELRRRERVLAAAGVTELAGLHRAVRLPRLVIVVDEFATVATELPQFLSGLLDIAQRGRSLGLHLVLATQRPAGVVSPAVRANIGTRICLRVVDEAESRDMLDLPDAAHLPTDQPGLGLLRRGREDPVLFRSVLSTRVPRTDLRVRRATDPPSDDRTGPSHLDRLVAVATTLAPARPPAPWLPPLPCRLELPDLAQFGLVDLPDEQRQPPWPVPDEPLLALGPAGSGRTGLLRRWAAGQAAAGAELLVVDTGTGLAPLADWPATSTRLDLSEPRLIIRLFDRLAAEIDRRAGTLGPAVALVVDGWDALAAALDHHDFGAWAGPVGTIVDRGPGCGVRVAVAGTPRARHHRAVTSMRTVVLLGEPADRPGRGRLGETGPQVQVAVAPTLVPGLPTARPARLLVRPLPGLVRRSQLVEPSAARPPSDTNGSRSTDEVGRPAAVGPSAATGTMHLGLGDDDARPVGWDLGRTRALLIAGPPGTGVTTALRSLVVAAKDQGLPALWVHADGIDQPRHPDGDGVAVVAGADALRPRLAAHDGPLLLVCDRIGELQDPALAELLTRFCSVAGPGQILALGARLDHALRSVRGPIPAVVGHRTGVLLSAEGAEGRLLGAVLPRRTSPCPPGRGHLFGPAGPVPIQVAVSE